MTPIPYSNMKLRMESDATYLGSPDTKGRAERNFYMGDKIARISPQSKLSTPIRIECILLRRVVPSTTKTEARAIFQNCKASIGIMKNSPSPRSFTKYNIINDR